MGHNKNIFKQIFVNTLTQYISKLISIILSFLSVSFLTRYLNADGYGKYTLIITYLSFFGFIADIGFNMTMVREYAININQSLKVRATYFSFKLILIIFSLVLSVVALFFIPYSSALKNAIIIGSVAFSIGNLMTYGTSILQSQLRLDLVAYIELFTKIITVLLIIFFVIIKLNLLFIISAILLGNITGLVLTFYIVRNDIIFKIYIDKTTLYKLLKISIPIGITSLFSLLYFKIDVFLLSLIKTSTDVGIYGLATNILDNILMLWGLIMASIFPLLSKYYANKQLFDFNNLLKRTIILLIITSVIILVGGNILNYIIMRLLGGSKFFSSMLPFRILLFSVPIFFINNVIYNIIIVSGKTHYLLFPFISSLVINLLLNLCLIPRYGYIGSSINTIITQLYLLLIYVLFVIKFFNKKLNNYG